MKYSLTDEQAAELDEIVNRLEGQGFNKIYKISRAMLHDYLSCALEPIWTRNYERGLADGWNAARRNPESAPSYSLEDIKNDPNHPAWPGIINLYRIMQRADERSFKS
jgi:hypothetical protein